LTDHAKAPRREAGAFVIFAAADRLAGKAT